MLTCHLVICFSAVAKVTWTLGECLLQEGPSATATGRRKSILPLEMLQNANVNLLFFATVLTSKSCTEGFSYENRRTINDGS